LTAYFASDFAKNSFSGVSLLETSQTYRFIFLASLITSSFEADLMHVKPIPAVSESSQKQVDTKEIPLHLTTDYEGEQRIARVNLPTTRVIKGISIGDSRPFSALK